MRTSYFKQSFATRLQLVGTTVVFVLAICLGGAVSASAQTSILPSEEALQSQHWKTNADVTAVLSAEHAVVSPLIADPNVQPVDKATYKAYNRLLTYMENDLPGGDPMPVIAMTSFKQVLEEAPADGEIKEMHEGIFRQYFDQLMEKLTTVDAPTPVPAVGQ